MRPSVIVRCSAIEQGSVSQFAAWSFGTTNLRHVSASLDIRRRVVPNAGGDVVELVGSEVLVEAH